MENKRVYELLGKIKSDYSCEELEIGGIKLAKFGEENLCTGEFVIINYLISKVKLTKEQFIEERLLSLFGKVDSYSYEIHGSEYTGYMYTNSKFKIDGHDLSKDLSYFNDYYCYIKFIVKKK